MTQYHLDDLLHLMARLRNPETGCPWDLKQDFASILPHTLEEAYEVADAIERQDWPHLEEELGDLLFQVIFYGQLGSERNYFNVASIIDRLVKKLIRRHPHVFPEGTLESEAKKGGDSSLEAVSQRWEEIKKAEKANTPESERLLDQVPTSMPALTRAYKLQKKASSVKFDWPDIEGVVDKIKEELAEVEEALAENSQEEVEKEIGDLLFAVINLARHKKVNPDTALRGTNSRFYQRFAYVEQEAQAAGGWEQLDEAQMNQAWNAAKEIEKRR